MMNIIKLPEQDKPKNKRRQGGLSRNEYLPSAVLLDFRQVMANLVSPRDRLIIEILSRTGMRSGELLQGQEKENLGRYLRLRDVNLDSKSPTIFVAEGKGGHSRVIAIHGTLRDLIQGYIKKHMPDAKPDWPLICSKPGIPLKTPALRMKCPLWQEMYEKATRKTLGADLHPHLFRHSFACVFLEANGSDMRALLMLKEVLGHASLSTTFVYLHTVETASGSYAQHLT
jgi:site-specific recombinase XerC